MQQQTSASSKLAMQEAVRETVSLILGKPCDQVADYEINQYRKSIFKGRDIKYVKETNLKLLQGKQFLEDPPEAVTDLLETIHGFEFVTVHMVSERNRL